MKIEIIYKNKDLEVVGSQEFTLNEYCHLLSQKTLSLLYQIEDFKNEKIEYSEIKKYIFNLAGSIQRLPDNIIDSNINIKESRMKKPEKNFFDFLFRGDGND